jgi:hypothetical protein
MRAETTGSGFFLLPGGLPLRFCAIGFLCLQIYTQVYRILVTRARVKFNLAT